MAFSEADERTLEELKNRGIQNGVKDMEIWDKERLHREEPDVYKRQEDVSEVALSSHQEQVKSVGNAITAPKDIKSFEDAKIVYYVLAESVASRLREQGLRGNVISVTLRSTELTLSLIHI